MSKQAVQFVVDIPNSMEPYEDLLAEILSAEVQALMMRGKTHEVGVILSGVAEEETKNALHDADPVDGLGVKELILLGRSHLSMLRTIQDGVRAGTAEGDVIAGLRVGIDVMTRRTINKKYERSVYLLTDCRTRLRGEHLQETLQMLHAQFINPKAATQLHLVLVGPRDETDEVQAGNEGLFRSIVASIGGGSVTTAEDLLREARGQIHAKNPRATAVNLTLGSKLTVPCKYFKKIDRFHMPTLKKEDTANYDPADEKSGAVSSTTMYRDVDMPSVDIAFEKKIKAARYGTDYVNIFPEEEDAMNYKFPDYSLDIIGFAPRDRIKRHEYMAESNVVIAMPGMQGAEQCISALSRALAMEGKERVAVARFTKKNGEPQLVALLPDTSGAVGYDRLLMNVLPFADDIRPYVFPSFEALPPSKAPSDAQDEATSQLIDALTLPSHGLAAAAGGLADSIRSGLLANPVARRVTEAIFARAMEPECTLPPEDDKAADELKPDPALMAAASEALSAYGGAFQLEKTADKPSKRKFYWSDMGGAGAEADDAKGSSSKRPYSQGGGDAKDEGGGGGGGASSGDGGGAAEQKEESGGGAGGGPAFFKADLEQLPLDCSEEEFESAAEAAQAAIYDQIGAAVAPSGWQRAATGCLPLRHSCVARGRAGLYNAFLHRLHDEDRASRLSGTAGFWEQVKTAGAGPITDAEEPKQGLSAPEAAAFFEAAAARLAAVPMAATQAPAEAMATAADEDELE